MKSLCYDINLYKMLFSLLQMQKIEEQMRPAIISDRGSAGGGSLSTMDSEIHE